MHNVRQNFQNSAFDELRKVVSKRRKSVVISPQTPEPGSNIFEHLHAAVRRTLKPQDPLEEELALGLLSALWCEYSFRFRFGTAKLTPQQRLTYDRTTAELDAVIRENLEIWFSQTRSRPAPKAKHTCRRRSKSP